MKIYKDGERITTKEINEIVIILVSLAVLVAIHLIWHLI